MSWPTYTSLNFSLTLRWICLVCKWTLSVALTAFGLSEGYSLGWMFGLKICQFDTCLFHLTVCTCVHCQSLCVLRVYVCVYMSELCCLFFFHDLTPYSVKEAETQWEPLLFLPYFLLLNVTSKQINSLRILISQEITYLIYITILLFLVCTHRAYMLSSLFIPSFLSLSELHTCIPTHTTVSHSHKKIHAKTQLQTLMGWWTSIVGDSLHTHAVAHEDH